MAWGGQDFHLAAIAHGADSGNLGLDLRDRQGGGPAEHVDFFKARLSRSKSLAIRSMGDDPVGVAGPERTKAVADGEFSVLSGVEDVSDPGDVPLAALWPALAAGVGHGDFAALGAAIAVGGMFSVPGQAGGGSSQFASDARIKRSIDIGPAVSGSAA